jgi:putative PIN family toxin of toxin-antitoxin system
LKVVLDTNVLVAALLKKGKAYRLLQYGLRNDRFDILSAPEQLAELKRILRQKFSGVLSKSEVGTFVNLFKEAAIMVRPQKGVNLSSDPDDNLLGIALAGGADFIVTGDKSHLRFSQESGKYADRSLERFPEAGVSLWAVGRPSGSSSWASRGRGSAPWPGRSCGVSPTRVGMDRRARGARSARPPGRGGLHPGRLGWVGAVAGLPSLR